MNAVGGAAGRTGMMEHYNKNNNLICNQQNIGLNTALTITTKKIVLFYKSMLQFVYL